MCWPDGVCAVQVGSLRAGRFYAVRLLARASAEVDGGSVSFSDTYTSDVVPFRTVPCTPGQMQAPSLARRDRTLLKVRWQPGCGSCVDVIKEAAVAWANRVCSMQLVPFNIIIQL